MAGKYGVDYRKAAQKFLDQKLGKNRRTGLDSTVQNKTNWQMQTKNNERGTQTGGSNTRQMQDRDPGRREQKAGSKTWQMGTGPLSLFDRLMQAATEGSLRQSDINNASSKGRISTKEFRKINDEFEHRRWHKDSGPRPGSVPNKPVK